MYKPFHISILKDNTKTPFDVYFKIGKEFILFAGKGYLWTLREIRDLTQYGFSVMYYPQEISEQFRHFYHQNLPFPKIDQSKSPVERLLSAQRVGADLSQAIFMGQLNKESIKKVSETVFIIRDALKENISTVHALADLRDYTHYTYNHSITVATVACALGIKMGFDDSDIDKIGIGALLHDVGKRDIPIEIINKPGPLDDAEWIKMKQHPILGTNTLHKLGVSSESIDIVKHHHEKIDATGYPEGLNRYKLSDMAQLSFLADVFSALTSTRSYHNPRTRVEALSFIKNRMKGQYNTTMFKVLVLLFADLSVNQRVG